MRIKQFVFSPHKGELPAYVFLSFAHFFLYWFLYSFSIYHLLISFLAYPFAIFAHEFGHYAMAKYVGHGVSEFRLGLMHGYVMTHVPENPIDLFHMYLVVVAGAFFNLMIGGTCSLYNLHSMGISGIPMIIGIAQANIALISLLPMKWAGPDQDGNQMMSLLDLAGQKGRFIHNVEPQVSESSLSHST